MELLLNNGYPFVSESFPTYGDRSPLLELAYIHATGDSEAFEIPDKIALYLKRGANVNCHDSRRNTSLHLAMMYLKSRGVIDRIYQNMVTAEYDGELKDILMLLITAGADIQARNDRGRTPSDIAWKFKHWQEWCGVLEECGYNVEEVVNKKDEATCWTSGTDTEISMLQSELLKFSEYLEIRKFRLRRIAELNLPSELPSEDWYMDDACRIEEESEEESEGDYEGEEEDEAEDFEETYKSFKQKAD